MKTVLVLLIIILAGCASIAPTGAVAESSLTNMKYQILRTNIACGKQSAIEEIRVLKALVVRLEKDMAKTQFAKDATIIKKNVIAMKEDGSEAYCHSKLTLVDAKINALIRVSGALRK